VGLLSRSGTRIDALGLMYAPADGMAFWGDRDTALQWAAMAQRAAAEPDAAADEAPPTPQAQQPNTPVAPAPRQPEPAPSQAPAGPTFFGIPIE
jgi:hypothetical protein